MSAPTPKESRVPLVAGLVGGAVGGLPGFHQKLTRKQAMVVSVLGGAGGSLAGTVVGNRAIGSRKNFEMKPLRELSARLDKSIELSGDPLQPVPRWSSAYADSHSARPVKGRVIDSTASGPQAAPGATLVTTRQPVPAPAAKGWNKKMLVGGGIAGAAGLAGLAMALRGGNESKKREFARGDYAEALLKGASRPWVASKAAAPEMQGAAGKFIRAMSKSPAFSPQQQSVRDLLAKRLAAARSGQAKEFARGDQFVKAISRSGGPGAISDLVSDQPWLRAIQKKASAGDVHNILQRPGVKSLMPEAKSQSDLRGAAAATLRAGRNVQASLDGKPFRPQGYNMRPMLSGAGA